MHVKRVALTGSVGHPGEDRLPSIVAEYEKLAASLATNGEVTSGQMFGKPCLKVNGKAFVSLHDKKLVFKLAGEHHKMALSLKSANLWDPSGKGRPMKEWVALSAPEAKHFKPLAAEALAYVRGVSRAKPDFRAKAVETR